MNEQNDLISRAALLAAYDSVHEGPPGKARDLILSAPPVFPQLLEQRLDREKVIRHITAELCIARTCKKYFASVDIDMLSDALDLLKEQEAKSVKIVKNSQQTVNGWDWISVKDRLPDGQHPVLVYVPPYTDGDEEYIGYVGMAYHTSLGEGFWAGTDGAVYGAIGMIHEPTHWMPLPEPPK